MRAAAALGLLVGLGGSVAVGVLGVASCQAITALPSSPAPVNACGVSADASCNGFLEAGCVPFGSSDLCATGRLPDLAFIISVPTTAPNIPGTTYTLMSSQLVLPTAPCTSFIPRGDGTCVKLPFLDNSGGAYLVSLAMQTATGRNVGVPTQSEYVPIPMTVTLWPQWLVNGDPVDVRQLKLPIPPVVASIGSKYLPPLSVPITPVGDVDGGLELGWLAGLPPLPGGSSYLGVVQVDPPFNDGYPDQLYSVSSNPNTIFTTTLPAGVGTGTTTQPVVTHVSVPVARAAGLEGWTVFVRANSSTIVPPQVVSSRWKFNKGVTSGNAPLNLINFPGFVVISEYSVVIEPPAGLSGLPNFADPIILGPPTSLETYPPLPPLTKLSGTVLSPESTTVPATLLFYSTSIYTQGASGGPCLAQGTGSAPLSYQAQVTTDDQGQFSLELPPGKYDYVLEPTAASGYAKVTVQANLTVGSCAGPAKNPVTLPASPRFTVSGSFMTADGRAVANANVDFNPAAQLVSGGGSGTASPTPLAQWPRPFTTTTGNEGAFTIEVDPGLYDITLRPQAGTGFAWLVSPGQFISSPVHFEAFSVPAPALVNVTIHDPSDNDTPIANAVVQAYNFYTPYSPPGFPAAPPVAVQVGEALTDLDGHFTMVVSDLAP